ncbi:unnamed protein product [Lasius platythorax]|uniref:Uncharacterized protein n=1 Tax=Lasius platythorax TaxID=488582 RepID=A0AAV2MXQ5_9HYME
MSSETIQIDLSRHLVIRDQDTNEVVITQNKCLLLWDKVNIRYLPKVYVLTSWCALSPRTYYFINMSLNIVFAANIAIEVPDFPQVRQYLDMEPVKSANKNDVISAKSSIYNDKKTTAF